MIPNSAIMKTVSLFFALLFLAGFASAQHIKQSEVPGVVVDAFQEQFMGSPAKAWEKEPDGSYEVDFVKDNKKMSAIFAADGALIQTENEIESKAMPEMALAIIKKDYADYRLDEVSIVTTSSGQQVYVAEMVKGKDKISVVFDPVGNFLNSQPIIDADH